MCSVRPFRAGLSGLSIFLAGTFPLKSVENKPVTCFHLIEMWILPLDGIGIVISLSLLPHEIYAPISPVISCSSIGLQWILYIIYEIFPYVYYLGQRFCHSDSIQP